MWTMEEELVDAHAHAHAHAAGGGAPAAAAATPETRTVARSCALLAVVGSLAVALVRALRPAYGAAGHGGEEAEKLPRYSV
mmetsp:Transcript_98580/g.307042  ORF Transcript_98580/g.307042 Transcript_98580/m.307042 type:complete len:81 (+) Transcript_98580:1-243(+)